MASNLAVNTPYALPSGLNNKGLYSPEQSRELDRIVIEDFGVAGIRLMKRAGRAAFAEITARWPRRTGYRLLWLW